MKPLGTAFLLMISSLPLFADVTKEEVRRLMDAHVSDQTLITYVQKNGPMQPLSIEDLSELKNAGASDDVLRALLDASRPRDGAAPLPPSAAESYSSDTTSGPLYDSPPAYSYSEPYYDAYNSPTYLPYSSYPAYSYSYYRPYRHDSPNHRFWNRSGQRVPQTMTLPRVPVPSGGVQPSRPMPATPSPPRPASPQGGGHAPVR
jgi:hypothetical protein